MIQEGYAYEYTYITPYKYQSDFKQAEQKAREQKVGLWSESTCNGIDTPAPTPVPTPIPTPTIGPAPTPSPTDSNCDSNYSGCVPIASDVDCTGGGGNGPAYVQGPVKIIGIDIYRLDRDGDGIACE